MAFDVERAARRLTDAGIEERASVGVADVMATATEGLATEASLLELRGATEASLLELKGSLLEFKGATEASVARLEARVYRALWLQGVGLLGAIVAATGVILAAMRLWM